MKGFFSAAKFSDALLLALMLLAFYAKFKLLFLLNINWDEFRFLSVIHKFNRNELTSAMQSFHVQLFYWLADIKGTEIRQIIVARMVMYCLHLGSCLFLYLISRKFFSPSASLFAVFSYVTFSFVQIHAASFRYDSICALLFLLSLFLALSNKRKLASIICSGTVFALALLISVKSILYLPIIASCLLIADWQKTSLKASLQRPTCFGVTAIIIFAGLYLLHKASLPVSSSQLNATFINKSVKNFITFPVFAQQKYLFSTLYNDFPLWAFLILGIAYTKSKYNHSNGKVRKNSAMLLSFSLSLFPLIFYRNIYPYFYVFMLAPASVFIAAFFDENERHFNAHTEKKGSLISMLLIFLVVTLNASTLKKYYHDGIAVQSELLAVIHRAFPEPVAYIDKASIVPSFKKAGFFMSSVMMERYLDSNRPIMEKILQRQRPLFLVANVPVLDISQKYSDFPAKYRLLEEDWRMLKKNYVHHWGKLFVAGKSFDLQEKNRNEAFEIMLPGIYTVETNGRVLIDGQLLQNGDVIGLKAGKHLLENAGQSGMLTLRWGNHLYRPDKVPLARHFFVSF